ncbi:S9 family peptidase [Pedobacter foliorum]|uniref:alpha/beta hydrolase family protein n=1 Tax=Pedobacter foliorum TaxID=2739058 RepID=UPI001565863D|nr:prolyl oligopeptidase family serine peptidase [Pedobacter foliorum]NRF37581.1 S9 family peptidase [Pedobacter foliorum]
MKSGFLFIWVLFYSVNHAFAQKPVLDSTAYHTWTSIDGGAQISNDGRYILYTIKNKPINSYTSIIRSIDFKWKVDLLAPKDFRISSNSKYGVFIKGKDSLVVLKLGTDLVRYITSIQSFKIKDEMLYYMPTDTDHLLVSINLNTGKEIKHKGIINYWLSEDGKVLVVKKKATAHTELQILNWIDIRSGKSNKVWEGTNIENLMIDALHKQLVFTSNNEIWHYRLGDLSSEKLMDVGSFDIQLNESKLYALKGFSKDGKRLYFELNCKKNQKSSNAVVEVWSYNDVKLQTEQQEDELNGEFRYVILDLITHKINYTGKVRPQFADFKEAQDSVALIPTEDRLLEPWSIGHKIKSSLISTVNGKKFQLDFLNNKRRVAISSSGKYLVWFDNEQLSYFSYEIATNIIRNITKDLPVAWTELCLSDRGEVRQRGIACWLKDDESLLIYDQHDIWKIDPLTKLKPINITNGFGLKHNIVFDLALDGYKMKGISKNEKLILFAFNVENKDNGFFRVVMESKADPTMLFMGPYVFKLFDYLYVNDKGEYPQKARDKELYLVRRANTSNSPNYFVTTDFKKFNRITNVQPEKKYNWFTTELHQWNSLDGRTLKGILYKPENFDPIKKYPIIFNYYERKSDGLNAYLKPDLSYGALDIPTYVSNGYLVFCPDIYYKISEPMQGTYDAVISAANYISTLPFVNPRKMGLQGHSFGGIQTNYLVTHSNIFAAAQSSSGWSDWVSSYGSLLNGRSLQFFYEGQGEQCRIGASLWDKPDAYIKSSSIFQVDKVTTPLLLMQGKKDGISHFANNIEFFTGLRRMGKVAWMLVYPEGNHSLEGNESSDFTIRMMQFFNFYLKDEPAPEWMLTGISAANSGIDNGFKLKEIGRIPGRGLLTDVEQKKVETLMKREPITIILK